MLLFFAPICRSGEAFGRAGRGHVAAGEVVLDLVQRACAA